MSNDKWISVETMLPTNGMVVDTKIDDQNGVRNQQKLERNGNRWWLSGGEMYAYYTPTHWRLAE